MSLAALSQQILSQARKEAETIAREERTLWRWATVVSVDPIMIQYDGEPPSIVPPETVYAAHVGERVSVASYKGQPLILGPHAGGDTGWLPVTLNSGWTGNPLVRNINGVVQFRGGVTGSLPANVTTAVGVSPVAAVIQTAVQTVTTGVVPVDYLAFTTGGVIQLRHSVAITGSFYLSALNGAPAAD